MPDDSEIHHIAVSIAQHNVFGDPYTEPTGPTAHSSPVYPGLKGEIYRLLGIGGAGQVTADLMSLAFASAEYALLPILGSVFGLPMIVGLCAGIAGALLPVQFITELRSYESLSAFLFVAATIATYGTWRDRRFSISRGIAHGLIWGFLVLTHAVFVPLIAVWLAAIWWLERRSLRVVLYAAGVLLSGVVVNAPWVIRNYAVLGEPVLFRSNFGVELYNANNPLAQVGFREYVATGAHTLQHPSGSPEVARRLRDLGEPAYNRAMTRVAIDWIVENPLRFFSLTVRRVLEFWFPSSGRPFQGVVLGGVCLLGLLGMYPLWKYRRAAAFLLLLTYLTFPGVYYILNAEHRHQTPLQPFFLLSASLLICWALSAKVRAQLGATEEVSWHQISRESSLSGVQAG